MRMHCRVRLRSEELKGEEKEKGQLIKVPAPREKIRKRGNGEAILRLIIRHVFHPRRAQLTRLERAGYSLLPRLLHSG